MGEVSGAELRVTDQGAVRVLELNRPRRLNAITTSLAREITAAFDQVDADPGIRVVVLTGSGRRAFCAGGDLHEMANGSAHDPRLITSVVMRRPAKPMLAAVNGLAFGGGLELVAACDLAVAARGASFALPETSRGRLASAGGLVRLPTIVGPRRAAQLALTARPIDAETALQWGLVNDVVDDAELMTCATDMASAVAANAPLAVRMSIDVVRRGAWAGAEDAWRLNQQYQAVVAESADAREGLRAFAERRPPRWTSSSS